MHFSRAIFLIPSLENIKILQCVDRSYPGIGGLENAVRDIMQRCVSFENKGALKMWA